MKITNISFALLMIMVSMASCTADYSPKYPENGQSERNRYTPAEKEAIETANQCMSSIFGKTRGIDRLIKNVCFDHVLGTRSGMGNPSDTACAVVNYNDDMGFVLLKKDTEGYRMYAIDEEGNLNLDDTVANAGLAYYIRSMKARKPIELDTTLKPCVPLPDPVVTVHKPMLSGSVMKWHQKSPYNVYCPMVNAGNGTNNTVHAVAGCAPLALGMMMSYFNWPATIDGRSFDWNLINSSQYDYIGAQAQSNEVAYLVKALGCGKYLNTQYGAESSSTVTNAIIPALKKLGYAVTGGWNTSSPAIYLGDGPSRKPVIVDGRNADNILTGHTWVMDGYMSITQTAIYNPSGNYTDYYYHCVWGDGGAGNGYYFVEKSYIKRQGYSDEDTSKPVSIRNQFINLSYLWDYTPVKQ